MKAEWKCVYMVAGALSVMTDGMARMLRSSADSWGTPWRMVMPGAVIGLILVEELDLLFSMK